MSKKTWKNGELVLCLLDAETSDNGAGYVRAEVMAVQDGKLHPINLSPWHAHDFGLDAYYGGLKIEAYVTGSPYRHFSKYFGSLYNVAYDELAARAKCLKRLEDGMLKLEAKIGGCEKFSHYVLRVAAIIGIETFIVENKEEPRHWSNYSDTAWNFMSAAAFGYEIDKLYKEAEEGARARARKEAA